MPSVEYVGSVSIDCGVWWSTPLEATPERLALLDPAEHDRYRAYRKDIDKRRFLTGRVLAKNLVADRIGRAPDDIVFDATDFGEEVMRGLDALTEGRVFLGDTELGPLDDHAPLRQGVAELSGRGQGEGPRADLALDLLGLVTRAAADVKPFLLRQVASPVRWTECVQRLQAEGATAFVEVGPGRVLTGLLRRILDGARGQTIEDTAGLDKALAALGASV